MASRIGHLTLDTPDLGRAVTFWAAVLGGEIWASPDGAIAVVSTPTGLDLMIQRVEHVAEGKNPVHLDLFTDDLNTELERLAGLGATELARHEAHNTVWATLTDLDGYVFDVVEHPE